MAPFFPIGRIAFVATAALLIACRTGDASNSKDNVERVAECVDYETALDRCYNRHTAFASQPSVIPKSKEDLQRIRGLCSAALQQLRQVCGSAAASRAGSF